MPGDEPLKNTFQHIWQPEKGLATSSKLILLFNNFHREKSGWKTKIKFDFEYPLSKYFTSKRIFLVLGFISTYLQKLNSDLKLVYGAHFLLICPSKSSLFNTLSMDLVSKPNLFNSSKYQSTCLLKFQYESMMTS